MKWIDTKFWCWLEISSPLGPQGSDMPYEPGEEIDEEALPMWARNYADSGFFGAGPQGPQGPQDVEERCLEQVPGIRECFDILAVNLEFELNAIPTATVSVALGRRADDVTKAADIHYRVDSLQLQVPAKIWCLATAADSIAGPELVANYWPQKKFKIFDGYITGSGFRRNNQGAELQLSLTHWLTDLNFSSAVSRQSHPLNAAQFFQHVNFVITAEMSAGGISNNGPFMVSPHMAMPYFSTITLLTDFWGGGISDGLKRWLLSLTRTDRINASQVLNISTGHTSLLNPSENWEACRALARFEPNAITPEVTETGYKLGVPLSMTNHGTLNPLVAQAIAEHIGADTLQAYTNVTFWDKLAGELHADYMYAIVPLVDKALIVPFIAGISSGDSLELVHRVLQTSDYESIEMMVMMPRPLRAVGVTMDYAFEAGGGMSKDLPAQYSTFGGWFDKWTATNDPRYREGLIMLKGSPKWLSRIASDYKYTPESTGTVGTVSTANAPNAGTAPAYAAPRTILQQARTVWDEFARTAYMQEVLKNRQGIISGPVRFDIAPGSSLKIEATEDKFVKQILFSDIQGDEECNEKYFKYFWCSVLRVSTSIDCQNMRASTNFHIAHIRDRQENKDPGTSIEYHPLWKRCKWAGCVLVDDPAFAPEATRFCDDE